MPKKFVLAVLFLAALPSLARAQIDAGFTFGGGGFVGQELARCRYLLGADGTFKFFERYGYFFGMSTCAEFTYFGDRPNPERRDLGFNLDISPVFGLALGGRLRSVLGAGLTWGIGRTEDWWVENRSSVRGFNIYAGLSLTEERFFDQILLRYRGLAVSNDWKLLEDIMLYQPLPSKSTEQRLDIVASSGLTIKNLSLEGGVQAQKDIYGKQFLPLFDDTDFNLFGRVGIEF